MKHLLIALVLLSALLRAGPLLAQPVTVCLENWRPYYFITDKGETGGVALNLVRGILSQAGFEAEFKPSPPKRCLGELAIGVTDMMLTTEPAPDGVKVGQTPLTFWVIAAIVREDEPAARFGGLSQFKERRALMINGYLYPRPIRDFGANWRVVETSYSFTLDEAQNIQPFRMIERDRADLLLEDMHWAERIIRKYQLKLKVLRPAITIAPGYAAYAPHRGDLHDLIERRLSAMAKSGELRRLYKEEAGIDWEKPDAPHLGH